MRRVVITLMLALLPGGMLKAQSLRDQLSQLFIFGEGTEALFLGGSGDPNNPESIRVHGSHFVPAAVASNATVINVLTNAIGSSATNVPVSAASGGATFRFAGGAHRYVGGAAPDGVGQEVDHGRIARDGGGDEVGAVDPDGLRIVRIS